MISHAKSEELFLRTILAVDQQGLMRGDVVGGAQVFKKRGFSRLQPILKKLRSRVAVGQIAPCQKVQGPFGVAGVDAFQLVDPQVRDESAARGEDVAQVGGPGRGLVNRLGPAHAAAKAHQDDVWPPVGRILRKAGQGRRKAGGKSQGSKGKTAAVHGGLRFVNSINITRSGTECD
jgi:hypothetical protein